MTHQLMHIRQVMRQRLADVQHKTGLHYLYDRQQNQVTENAFFADMRLRESVNYFDPSFSLPSLPTAATPPTASSSDTEYEEVFKQFTAFPDTGEENSTGNESLSSNTELSTLNDEPLEIWPLPLPLPHPPVVEQEKTRTISMDEVVERAAKRKRTVKTEATTPTATPGPSSNPLPKKPFPCSDCELSFARKHDFDRHMRKHTGDLPYLCHGCNQGFKRTDARDRHWRRHPDCKLKDDDVVKNTEEGKRRARRLEARRMRDKESASAP